MRRMFTVLAAGFVAVAFSSMVFAQAAEPTKAATEKKIAKAEQTEKAPAAAKKAVTPSATGKVAKYDAATKTLTVTTKKGDENFTLTADTKIMAGAKAAKEEDLTAGKSVKVAYTEANGQMTATAVKIGPAAKATTKAPAEKKEPAAEKK